MSVIEFKMGELTFSKKPTVKDVMAVYKAMANAEKSIEEGNVSDTLMSDYNLLVELFGEKGLTLNEMLEQPAEFYQYVSEQTAKIVEIILGNNEEKKKKATTKKKK